VGVKLGGVVGLLVAVPIASFIKGTADTIRGTRAELPALVTAEVVTVGKETQS
jgi:predicted PurR-regulated permease PerM